VSWARRAPVAAILCALALAFVAPGTARADGDPASDVLLGQDVFAGYGSISAKVQDELESVTAAAGRAGYPVRIALIAGKGDLGSVPQEFGHPAKYAYFLDYEISTAVSGVVVVVMPKGFGVASGGRPQPQRTALLNGIPIGPGTNGLGIAAVAATEKLAAAAGHPLAGNAASASVPLTASGASISRALETLLVLAVLAALAVTAAVVARRRRRGAATTARVRASR
jgi:hypothetical protein